MVLCNSLLVLPRHGMGIIVRDDLQGQEILRLNGKEYTTIYNLKDKLRSSGFFYQSGSYGEPNKWYLKTQNNTDKIVSAYHKSFSTTYRLSELEHYWLCPDCLSAVPDTWTKCTRCK